MRMGKGQNLTITPDGPRGPRRRLAAGSILLSSYLKIPLIPIGLGYDRPWRMRRTWDQFAIPRPGSRARAVVGPRVCIPAALERHEIECYRARVEGLLTELTERAELWAESGARPAIRVPVQKLARRRPAVPAFVTRSIYESSCRK